MIRPLPLLPRVLLQSSTSSLVTLSVAVEDIVHHATSCVLRPGASGVRHALEKVLESFHSRILGGAGDVVEEHPHVYKEGVVLRIPSQHGRHMHLPWREQLWQDAGLVMNRAQRGWTQRSGVREGAWGEKASNEGNEYQSGGDMHKHGV